MATDMPKPASACLGEFFDTLRNTGTNLPFRNSQMCALLQQALEDFNPSAFNILDDDADDYIPQILVVEEMIDQLAMDLEVIEEALRYQEEQIDAQT